VLEDGGADARPNWQGTGSKMDCGHPGRLLAVSSPVFVSGDCSERAGLEALDVV
jgi:hypothetical protein